MENQQKPSRPQNAQSNKFDEVNSRQDDMGFADENQEAATAGKNPIHYSHSSKAVLDNSGPQSNAPQTGPDTNPVAGATVSDLNNENGENRNSGRGQ